MIFIKRKSALKPISGEIVDTENISNKKKNTYSARIIEKLFGVEVIKGDTGTAIKYADGRMECYGLASYENATFTTVGNVYYRALGSVRFPVVFKEAPCVVATCTMGNIGAVELSSITTEMIGGFNVISASAQARTVAVYWQAKGFWK